MGFWKSVAKFFTVENQSPMVKKSEVKPKENKDATEEFNNMWRKKYEEEGLDYKGFIYKDNVYGVEKEIGDIISVILFTDRIRFRSQLKSRDLMFKDIIDLEVLTNTQIEEKSKLGQFALIGVMALATKKKTTEVVKRNLVIHAEEYGIRFSIIIDTIHDALIEAKKIKKELEEFKKSCE